MERKKVSQGKTPRKKDKIKFLKKVNGYPFTFLKIKKKSRELFYKMERKKVSQGKTPRKKVSQGKTLK